MAHRDAAFGRFGFVIRADMAFVVPHRAVPEPGPQAVRKERVGKILAPKRGILDPGFGQAPV